MKSFLKKTGILIIVFTILNIILNYVYELPAKKAIKNKIHKNSLKWNDIHKNQNTYDLITIGASRAYRSFNPNILDSKLNLNSYNMGTSAQDIAESYYTLKEILKYQKPKFVILDLFLPSSDDKHDFYQIYSNASFFSSNKTKYNLIIDGYGATGVANYCIPILKFKNYIKKDINSFFSNRSNSKPETNWIKGFSYDTITVTQKEISNFYPISNFENTSFKKERFNEFFNKIKQITLDNNIKLICVRTPYPPSRLALNKIDDENAFFRNFTKKSNIPYYDLNTFENHKYKYIDSDFSDYHHPNYKGAQKASWQLIEIINKLRK